MSDGNFKRSLLPTNSFSSGLRTGEARMRQRATDALRALLEERLPQLNAEERAQLLKAFTVRLQAP